VPETTEPATTEPSTTEPSTTEPATNASLTECPACGASVGPGERYCEACGHDLREPAPPGAATPPAGAGPAGVTAPADAGVSAAPPESCASCGGTEFTNGYCDQCGTRRPAAATRSEIDFITIAGVSDIGQRHHHNEDAMGILAFASDGQGVAAGVVCDGVSSSNRPDLASTAAVTATVRAFATRLAPLVATPAGTDADAIAVAEDAMRAGGQAAQAAAALAAAGDRGPNPPSSTFVAAILTPRTITVGWVGDSRAYWLPDAPASPVAATPKDSDAVTEPQTATEPDGADHTGSAAPPVCLTVDDTLAGQLAAAGVPVKTEAPAAGALVRWLGTDATDTVPHVVTITPDRPGRVIVCSDGLYRYAPDPAGLAAITPPGAPFEVASTLVKLALDAGGQDNVSVIVMPFPPPPHQLAPSTS
jgi:serine/threonine protein phosphatase PrpC